ncbi:hypothetical protein [Azospirillum sp. B506]|uniref:hypothetical protein n=1 Tax=Azospirillum sp. B506 TaxID=137721 RepID=UPI0003467FA6|nr:hypothetical protein [Azospirillum sp. B506]
MGDGPSGFHTIVTPVSADLFQLSAGDGRACWLYFVPVTSPQPPAIPTISDIWNDPAWAGWLVFTALPVTSGLAPAFVEAVQAAVVGTQPFDQFFFPIVLWVNDPATFTAADIGNVPMMVIEHYLESISPPEFQELCRFSFPNVDGVFGTFAFGGGPSLSISESLPLSLIANAQGNPVLRIWALPVDADLVQVGCGGDAAPCVDHLQDDLAWSIDIPLSGPNTGGFCFSAGLPANFLMTRLNPGFCYQAAAPTAALWYPFLPPEPFQDDGGDSDTCIACDIAINPILVSGNHLLLHLDASTWPCSPQSCANAAGLCSSAFMTPGGGSVDLVPCSGAADGSPLDALVPSAAGPPGFVLAQGLGPGDGGVYLAPVGQFQVVASGVGTPPDTVDVMGGLSVQEFLRVADGDRVGFAPFQPASATPGSPAAALTSGTVTSWMQYPMDGTSGGQYFSQSSAATFFALDELTDSLVPINAMLSRFAGGAAQFPIVPYGGFAPWLTSRVLAAGVIPPAGDYQAFEAAVLSPTRSSLITAVPAGAIFCDNGTPNLTTAITRQGLVVQMAGAGSEDPAPGSWQELWLAETTGGTDGTPGVPMRLGFTAPAGGVIDSAISSAMVQDGSFVVMTVNPGADDFSNVLEVGGINLRFDLSGASPNTGTILVFKLTDSASFSDLAVAPERWTAASTLIGDAATVGVVQARLIAALQQAEDYDGQGGNPFTAFNNLVDDPTWTGLIGFDVAIDGLGMPPDLLMVLGGISGSLTAHHVGIQSNTLVPTTASPAAMMSSLFGVIAYSNDAADAGGSPPNDPLAYSVQQLLVVIENTSIARFNAVIALTVNELFGRAVALRSAGTPGDNAIRLNGSYQSQGGQGSLVFNSTTPFVFDIVAAPRAVRILDSVTFNSATLAPFASGTAATPGDTIVVSRMALGGQLFFAADPFGTVPMDLFSFGSGDQGLAFDDFVVEITTTFDGAGGWVSTTCQPLPDLLQVQSSQQAIREGSLLGDLPLKPTGFAFAEGGLDLGQTGAVPLHCPELMTGWRSGGTPTTSPHDADNAALAPYVTSTPTYALTFDLPLGTLGALSSIQATLTAGFYLGWGPSAVVPGSDAVSVWIKMPQLTAGSQGITLQGILSVVFGDANLVAVPVDGEAVYALMLSNVQISLFGYKFPPGIMINFLLFAGSGGGSSSSNLAWFVSAQETS